MSFNKQNNQKPKKDPTVFDDTKLRLYASPLEPGGRKPSLKIRLIENNPVIDIDYGTRDQKDRAVRHETPLNPVVLMQLVTLIIRCTRAKGQYAVALDNWGHPFIYDRELQKNVRSKERMNLSRIEVGRTEGGVIYIKYTTFKKPELEFHFGEDEWHKLLDADGNQMQFPGQSAIAAEAWAETIKIVYGTYYSTKWEEPEWRKKFRLEQAAKFAGGGQNGGYNKGGNSGGGGYNKPAQSNANTDDFDEDVPF